MVTKRIFLSGALASVGGALAVLDADGARAQTRKANAMGSVVIQDISLGEVKAGLADGSIVLIDIREKNEWDAGRIPGALFNPLSAFDVNKLPPAAPGKKIVLYCRSGNRSKTALAQAQAQGRGDVVTHYAGAMLEWQAAGEKVER